MPFDSSTIQNLIEDLVDEILEDAQGSADTLVQQLRGENLVAAKRALRRYAENQLLAIQEPDDSERHLLNAAHNLNTLVNLTALTKIQARDAARDFSKRVWDRVFELAFGALDAVL